MVASARGAARVGVACVWFDSSIAVVFPYCVISRAVERQRERNHRLGHRASGQRLRRCDRARDRHPLSLSLAVENFSLFRRVSTEPKLSRCQKNHRTFLDQQQQHHGDAADLQEVRRFNFSSRRTEKKNVASITRFHPSHRPGQ